MASKQFIRMKRNDLLPKLRLRLVDDNNPQGVDLSTAVEVRLLIKDSLAGVVRTNAVMTVEDQTQTATKGVVNYQWVSADTNTAGDFDMEIQVTWPVSKPQTWPLGDDTNPQFLTFRVEEDLGP